MLSRRTAALLVLLPLATAPAGYAQGTGFSRLSQRLSEPGGYFDSDNLVSNETSYLHVIGALRERGVHGGAYIGVGPEQGFSYIAAIEPEIAIIIDIRRDNLLLHLLMKAMFHEAHNRLEYLCLLYGRPVPPHRSSWDVAPLDSLVAYLDRTPLDTALHARQHAELMRRVERFGLPLSVEDRATVRRFHDEFALAGLDLHYASLNRVSRRNYPTQRRLYTETDAAGDRASYLSTERRWRVVRDLQRHDRIVPVVGNLAGAQAMGAIAAYLREKHWPVSAFYTSNVEQYLFQFGSFGAFATNVAALPAESSSTIIRSWFIRGGGFPGAAPGHLSTQQLHPFARFLALTRQADQLNAMIAYGSLLNDADDMVPAAPTPNP
jgi:hypothetical protein